VNVRRHRVLDICSKLLQCQRLVDEMLDVLRVASEPDHSKKKKIHTDWFATSNIDRRRFLSSTRISICSGKKIWRFLMMVSSYSLRA
jgi:hypothetical protein